MLNPRTLARHPLFACPLRPMFLATALYGAVGLALSVGALRFGLVLPAVPGGALAWHAHELMFGFVLASIAGFVLTAVPEFTGTPAFGPRIAVLVGSWWLLARIAFWLSGTIGPWPAAVSNVGLALLLPALLGARLLRDPERRHVAFLRGLLAFAIAAAGFHVEALLGRWPMRWIDVAIGVTMVLIVVTMSRVSMRIVNDSLDAARKSPEDDRPEYFARPPRRNLAIFAIALHTAVAFFAPASAVTGWLALAAAAALLNVLNDWHVGRPLFARWPSMLYAVYWLMAAGYAALGLQRLDAATGIDGRHLLTAGAMGLSIYAVLCIAGSIHAGRPLDDRAWVPFGATLLVLGALARASAGLPGAPGNVLVALASIGWVGAFALVLRHLAPAWCSARTDGGQGCEEWIDPGEAGSALGRRSGGQCDSRRSTSSSSIWPNSSKYSETARNHSGA